MLIASEFFVDELEQGVKLLVQWLLKLTSFKQKALFEESKSRKRPKNISTKPAKLKTQAPSTIPAPAFTNKESATKPLPLTQKQAIFIIETLSKIYKSKTYKKVINNLIYSQHWRKTIKKELQNLENY